MKRPVDSLTAEDFNNFPVWRFTSRESPEETWVTPLKRLPTKQLNGCIVGSQFQLANQTALTGFLGNLDPSNPRLTEHFLTLSVFRSDGAVFHLARYHDYDAVERGPAALATFLSMSLDAIFPIKYDVSHVFAGAPNTLRGIITAEPKERLSRADIIALAVP